MFGNVPECSAVVAILPVVTQRRWEALTILQDALCEAIRSVKQRYDENDPAVYEALNQLRQWKAEVEVQIEEEPVPPGGEAGPDRLELASTRCIQDRATRWLGSSRVRPDVPVAPHEEIQPGLALESVRRDSRLARLAGSERKGLFGRRVG